MVMLWDSSRVTCDVLEVGQQHIHLQGRCKITQEEFMITFVYPVYSVPQREVLWRHLTQLGVGINKPWCIMGDFNCYCSPTDKSGGQALRTYDMKHLEDFRVARGLEDAPSTGSYFTWTNGSIWTKLDRVFINQLWGTQNLTCTADFLPMEPVSDHCPVIATLGTATPRGNRPFKFLNMWMDHHRFEEILTEHWGKEYYGMEQFKLSAKLRSMKQPLKILNRDEYGSIAEKASAAVTAFKDATSAHMADPGNENLRVQCHQMRQRANFLLDAERSFIRQKQELST